MIVNVRLFIQARRSLYTGVSIEVSDYESKTCQYFHYLTLGTKDVEIEVPGDYKELLDNDEVNALELAKSALVDKQNGLQTKINKLKMSDK